MRDGINAGKLKKMLADVPDDWEVTFGGVLEFHRLKQRGAKLMDIEFNQVIYRDETGRILLDDVTYEGRVDDEDGSLP